MSSLPTEYKSSLPYPEITDATYDPQAVYVLKKLYCSRKSETTAVLQYMYQHFVTDKAAGEISKILAEIGRVEMHHLQLLAEAMVEFGGDPVYCDSGAYWSGRWVNYCKPIKSMLQIDLQDEIDAVYAYKSGAQIVSNKSLQKLLLRIAVDEELHAKIITKLLEDLQNEKTTIKN